MTLAESFPASDPPFWTFGVSAQTARPAAIDVVVREGHRFGVTRLANLGEAIAIVAALPLAILIAGAPVVAVVWGLTQAVRWLARSG